jgi:hypothetical protein
MCTNAVDALVSFYSFFFVEYFIIFSKKKKGLLGVEEKGRKKGARNASIQNRKREKYKLFT